MEEMVAINVRYEGDNEPSQIFQLNRQTQWRDLEAMLKALYDCEEMEVFYVDTEGDYVTISSQEELQEAFKVALQCSNTLHLKLRNFTGLPVVPGDNTQGQAQGGGDTDVKIMIESAVDPQPCPQPPENQDIQRVEVSGDTSEAELEKLAQWLHEESKPPIRCAKFELEMTPDVITPSEDEKEETGELKPTEVQRDEETGAVYVKPKVPKQKMRKTEKSGHEHKRRHCKSAERSRRHRHEDELGDTSDDSAMPYDVFIKYMQQLKLELRTEIVRDVTRKTVKQVLKGLDGAVIQSMKGGNSADVSEAASSPTKLERQKSDPPVEEEKKLKVDPTSSHPVYYHEHVTCDFCERTIVGARYKCCNCPDYDLCEECEAIHGVHDPHHVFLKIRRPVCLRNKTPLLKQIIYRTKQTENVEARKPIYESAEEMLKYKFEKLKYQLNRKEKHKKREEKAHKKDDKTLRKQKKKEERLHQWIEAIKSPADPDEIRHIAVESLMAADFMYDVTIPDGTRVQPGTRLLKTWRIRNAGTTKWTSSTKLKVVYDCIPTTEKEVTGQEGEITVELVAPEKPGRYQSHWKMFSQDHSFGHRVWCDILVEPKEVLEPTKDDTLKLVSQPQECQHLKSDYEQIPEQEVKIVPTEDFLLEPRETSLKSDEQNKDNNKEGESHIEENIKIVVADSVAEIADKMVDFVCEQMDRHSGQEVDSKQDGDAEECNPAMKGDNVKEKEEIDESIGKSGDESDFSDRQGFLHVKGPDLIAFELVEPGKEEHFENAEEYLEEKKEADVVEALTERKEEVQIEERQILSRSSSVEVVNMTQDESANDEEIQDHGYLRSLQNRIDENVDFDDDSMSDASSYDIYNDSEDDFLVVPMPACFNLEKPITFRQPEYSSEDERGDNLDDNHNMIADQQSRVSVDDILTTSGVIATPPMEPESVVTPQVEAEANLAEAAIADPFGTKDQDTFKDFQNGDETDSEETKVVEIPALLENTIQEEKEEVASPVITLQPSQEGATAMESTDNKEEQRPAELVNQIMHTAVKAANRAAANAYTTAKEVFYTWQARTYQNASGKHNDFKPPTSSWKPKENSFKVPQSNWMPKEGTNPESTARKSPNSSYMPPNSEWKPQTDKWQPPKEIGPMGKLKEMGFCNRELNEKLLKKHNDDVEAVVQEILATTENDWMEQRH